MTYLLTLAVLLAAALVRPDRAACPATWWLDLGVRPTGEFRCTPIGPDRSERGPRGGWIDVTAGSEAEIRGRIYCSNGTRPITRDGRAVGCQR